jgi:hypothetical protein
VENQLWKENHTCNEKWHSSTWKICVIIIENPPLQLKKKPPSRVLGSVGCLTLFHTGPETAWPYMYIVMFIPLAHYNRLEVRFLDTGRFSHRFINLDRHTVSCAIGKAKNKLEEKKKCVVMTFISNLFKAKLVYLFLAKFRYFSKLHEL